MHQARRYFQQELEDLERLVQAMGASTEDLFERSLGTISARDPQVCEEVIAGDDQVDAYYLTIERRVLDLLALQTPVAGDLRLLTALLHIDLHLERMADQAVNIAKIVRVAWGLPHDPAIVQRLEEMGALALRSTAAAMDAFARRDLELCRRLTDMDDAIDRLNRSMPGEVMGTARDRGTLEWAIAMHVVSREIERVGDHAVDIAEQVAFLITGEFVEFTDASHPSPPRPEVAGTGGT